MDTQADDLADLIEALDLHDPVLVGHSTGGGEDTRYLGRHGSARVAKAVLVAAVPPLMLKTDANPGGLPIETFDAIGDGLLKDRSQFYQDVSAPFYGANRPGPDISQGLRDWFWLLSMQVGFKAAYDCVKAFSETDMTEDLKKIDVPVLIVQGDDDQIVPLDDSGRLPAQIVKDATLKVYPGARTAWPIPRRTRTRSTRTCWPSCAASQHRDDARPGNARRRARARRQHPTWPCRRRAGH